MVSLRPFTTFLFGLTLSISLHSFAFSLKDMEEKQVLVAAALVGRSPLSPSKEIFGTRGEAGIEEIGGRKMMKKDIFKAQEINIVDSKILGTTSDKSENVNVGQRRRLEVRMDDSVSLDADYKAPKSHPPKNN